MTEDSKANQPGEISIFGIEETDDRAFFLKRHDDIEYGRSAVPIAELESRVSSFIGSLGGILGRIATTVGQYELDEVEVKAEISAKGTVSLLGTGGEVGGNGGLTFTFRRRHDPPPQAENAQPSS